jgi:uncharacterized protein
LTLAAQRLHQHPEPVRQHFYARRGGQSLGKKLCTILFTAQFCFSLFLPLNAAEVIPPPPERYFNDYAKVISPPVSQQLNAQLEQFERDTSNQIVVAIFPKMQSDSSIEDYTVRVAQSWKVGQEKTDNGAVLFVFVQDRKLYLQTGYGLEGALPDVLAKRIIDDEITPHFKQGNFDAGVTAGVDAILKAVHGEYKGSGRTVRENEQDSGGGFGWIVFLFVLLMLVSSIRRRPKMYGRRQHGWGGWYLGGGGWSGGGGGGFSGGGFSGGGGSFGGGGAGGSW